MSTQANASNEMDGVREIEREAWFDANEATREYIKELQASNEELKKQLHQQRFNNKNNLSIDQKVADEIARLKQEISLLKAQAHFIEKASSEELKNSLHELQNSLHELQNRLDEAEEHKVMLNKQINVNNKKEKQ